MATEKRLIDANDVLGTLADIMREMPTPIDHYDNGLYSGLDRAFEIVEQASTVDAVEVVRCKDCKMWEAGDSWMGDSDDDMQRAGSCPIVRFRRLENDYCSYGERKTATQKENV